MVCSMYHMFLETLTSEQCPVNMHFSHQTLAEATNVVHVQA